MRNETNEIFLVFLGEVFSIALWGKRITVDKIMACDVPKRPRITGEGALYMFWAAHGQHTLYASHGQLI